MLTQINFPELIGKVRSRADLVDSQFQTDDEIKDIIEDSFSELYNEILRLKAGFFLKEVDDLQPVEKNKIIFPDDLYKIRLLEQKYSENHYRPIKRRTLEEVSGISGVYFDSNELIYPTVYGYVNFDDHLRIYPQESAESYRFRLSYGRDIDLETHPMREEIFRYLKYQSAYICSVVAQNPNDRLLQIASSWRNGILKWFSERDRTKRGIQDTYNAYGVYL